MEIVTFLLFTFYLLPYFFIVVMKVLIIGIDSFTGKYLQEIFTQNQHQVFGTTAFANKINSQNQNQNQIQNILFADLHNIQTLIAAVNFANPDVVINLAAQSFVAADNIGEFYQTNVVAVANLAKVLSDFNKNNHKNILFIQPSSANIYGNASGKINEQTPPNPLNHYATSKFAMEMMLKQWQNEINICVVRPFNYTGVGQNISFVIAKLVHNFQHKNAVIELGNLDVARDFTDVRDVARAYLALAESKNKISGEVFNISSGKSISLQSIINSLMQKTNFEPKIVVNPLFVRKNEIKDLYGNSAKLNEFIGENWRQITNFDETLTWMLNAK